MLRERKNKGGAAIGVHAKSKILWGVGGAAIGVHAKSKILWGVGGEEGLSDARRAMRLCLYADLRFDERR